MFTRDLCLLLAADLEKNIHTQELQKKTLASIEPQLERWTDLS